MEIDGLTQAWKKARGIPKEDVLVRAVENTCGYTFAFGWVRSQAHKRRHPNDQPVGYGMTAMFNKEGRLVGCECRKGPHFRDTNLKGKAVPLLRGLRVCKHVLAFSIAAQEMVNELL